MLKALKSKKGFAGVAVAVGVGVMAVMKQQEQPKKVVNIIALHGEIGESSAILGTSKTFNYDKMESIIVKSFENNPVAVALSINSGGGSPAQSSMIMKLIKRQSIKKKIPVIAFVQDIAASGGYMVALAADEIYADEFSTVGSIGVVRSDFGFVGLLKELGIERRLMTSGNHKATMDPFSRVTEEEKKSEQKKMDVMHKLFIDMVKTSRGDKLDKDHDYYNGDVWIGKDAVSNGLIDGIGYLAPVMLEKYGDDVTFVQFKSKEGLIKSLMGG